jgi:hypothetical protein
MGFDASTLNQPCELHELTGCSICSGLDKQQTKEDRELSWQEWTGIGMPERVAPGVVKARYAGKCAGCGEAYPVGETIRFSESANGWVGAVCC